MDFMTGIMPIHITNFIIPGGIIYVYLKYYLQIEIMSNDDVIVEIIGMYLIGLIIGIIAELIEDMHLHLGIIKKAKQKYFCKYHAKVKDKIMVKNCYRNIYVALIIMFIHSILNISVFQNEKVIAILAIITIFHIKFVHEYNKITDVLNANFK